MKKRENNSGVIRLINTKDRAGNSRKTTTKYIAGAYEKQYELNKIAERKDKQIKALDERYSVIVKLFMNEVEKRKIDITAPDFTLKMEEILEEISKGKFFQSRFSHDNVKDIKNAILRKVNSERRIEEKGRDDE